MAQVNLLWVAFLATQSLPDGVSPPRRNDVGCGWRTQQTQPPLLVSSRRGRRNASGLDSGSSLEDHEEISRRHRHCVNGIDCVQVTLRLPRIGPVSILEATAEAQETLVNLALQDEQNAVDSTDGRKGLALPSGDPYGAVLWPAAYAVASHLLLLHHDIDYLHGKTVLEVGTGTGLVALSAAMGGATSVLATDYEEIPLQLLRYAATHLNSIDDASKLQTQLFDICNLEQPLPRADVLVAADIMYEPITGRAMAHRVVEALQAGIRVVIGDSPGRAGRPAFLKKLYELGLDETAVAFVDSKGWTVTGDRHELICGKESKTVSPIFPQELTIAIMDLDPEICFR